MKIALLVLALGGYLSLGWLQCVWTCVSVIGRTDHIETLGITLTALHPYAEDAGDAMDTRND